MSIQNFSVKNMLCVKNGEMFHDATYCFLGDVECSIHAVTSTNADASVPTTVRCVCVPRLCTRTNRSIHQYASASFVSDFKTSTALAFVRLRKHLDVFCKGHKNRLSSLSRTPVPWLHTVHLHVTKLYVFLLPSY
jgi:hypothetical protein